MALCTTIDVVFEHIVVAAQTVFGGNAVLWTVTDSSGITLGSGKTSTLALAVTAASAVVNANTLGGL